MNLSLRGILEQNLSPLAEELKPLADMFLDNEGKKNYTFKYC